jgi:hypothetical protein
LTCRPFAYSLLWHFVKMGFELVTFWTNIVSNICRCFKNMVFGLFLLKLLSEIWSSATWNLEKNVAPLLALKFYFWPFLTHRGTQFIGGPPFTVKEAKLMKSLKTKVVHWGEVFILKFYFWPLWPIGEPRILTDCYTVFVKVAKYGKIWHNIYNNKCC